MTGADLERYQPTGVDAVDRAVAVWSSPLMCPPQFRDKQGNIDRVGLALAASWLYALDVPPAANIGGLYLVNGRIGVYADLQRALVARAGYHLEIVESTDQLAEVRIRHGDGPWHHVTFTAAQATKAGLLSKDNWKNYLVDMMVARACTRAVNYYAPGALRGITAAADHVAALDDDETEPGPSGSAEIGSSATPAATSPEGPPAYPPRAVAPSGATIPEHLREPALDENERRRLLERIAGLDDHHRAVLNLIWFDQLGCPNPKTDRATAAHGALLDRLITELTGQGPTVPADVYDQDPESTGAVDADQEPSYADPDAGYGQDGEPF
jgi:hypothetical protein